MLMVVMKGEYSNIYKDSRPGHYAANVLVIATKIWQIF